MDCQTARELLPWLGNRTLEAEEAAALERHLRDCEGCRSEAAATDLAARLTAAHPTPEQLVSFVFGEDEAHERPLLQRHLAECARCREELELVRSSRRALEAEEEEVPSHRRGSRWLALAAGLAAVVAAGGWVWTWAAWERSQQHWQRQLAAAEQRLESLQREPAVAPAPADPSIEPDRDAAEAAVPTAVRERGRAEERVAALEEEVARLRRPAAGVAVVDLWPQEAVLRGAGATPTVSAGEAATLLLAPPDLLDPRPTGRLRLETAEGELVWERPGIDGGEHGEVTVHLPAGSLPPGGYRLLLVGRDGEPAGTYPLRVVP